MSFKFGSSSLKKLEGVDKRLVEVLKEAISISPVDFTIVEGIRTMERQKELVKEGKSKTLKSKHIDGLAVDVCACVPKVDFNAMIDTALIVGIVYAIANKRGIKLRLGAIWDGHSYANNSFKDLYHIELVD